MKEPWKGFIITDTKRISAGTAEKTQEMREYLEYKISDILRLL